MKTGHLFEFFLFPLLILLQFLLFSRINLFGLATPVVYGYFLLKLPMERNPFM